MCAWITADGECTCGSSDRGTVQKYLNTTQKAFNRAARRGVTLRDKRQCNRWLQILELRKKLTPHSEDQVVKLLTLITQALITEFQHSGAKIEVKLDAYRQFRIYLGGSDIGFLRFQIQIDDAGLVSMNPLRLYVYNFAKGAETLLRIAKFVGIRIVEITWEQNTLMRNSCF